MIAAIYARKSTEQTGFHEEGKSVTRQIEHARAYAEKKGWSVADDHIYSDDGISGAEFVKRPGFLRLMNALKPRPPFQVLVMSEESRLGREAIETSYTFKQVIDDMAMKSGRYTRNMQDKGALAKFIPSPGTIANGSGSSALCLVEARGVEPLSEDRQCTVSTCVADNLSFAAIHARRQA